MEFASPTRTEASPARDPGRSRVAALRREVAHLRAELAEARALAPGGLPAALRQRTIIESTSDYVFVKDQSGRYVDANSAYLSALGLPASQLLGKRDSDLFPPDEAAESDARDCIALISGQVLESEASVLMGGRRRHLLVRRSTWRDEEGHPLGVVTVATDITERKEVELQREAALANLRASTDRVQGLLDEQIRLSQRGSALLDLTRRLLCETSVAGILRVGLDVAERQLSEAAVLVADCAGARQRLSVRAAGERAQALLPALEGVASAASFSAETLRGQCATSVLLDRRYRFDAALLGGGMKAATAMPIAGDFPAVPIIVAAWPRARQCPPEDLWFLENLAVQLALALRNPDLDETVAAPGLEQPAGEPGSCAPRPRMCGSRSSSRRA